MRDWFLVSAAGPEVAAVLDFGAASCLRAHGFRTMTRPAKAANMFFARSFGNGGTVCQTKRGREAAGKTH